MLCWGCKKRATKCCVGGVKKGLPNVVLGVIERKGLPNVVLGV